MSKSFSLGKAAQANPRIMVDWRRLTFILSFICGVFLVTPIFASENPAPIPEIEIQATTLPTFPKEEEIVLVIDGKVIASAADEREIMLTDFLKAKRSPLTGNAADFIRVADRYELDYRFLPAITGLESSWGTRLPSGSHNPFGWGPSIRFASFADAIETVGNGIRTRYVKAGKVTPVAVGPRYAASPTWSSLVTSFMLAIDKSPL